jgi:hypothetical protein
MNTTASPELIHDLRSFVRVCEDLLSLSSDEHQALVSGRVEMAILVDTRKNLLTRLNEVLLSIKNWRKAWQQQDQSERAQHPEVKALLGVLQQMIVRILQLDRENQQSLLRAGMLPARHLPPAATQQPGFVARLYSRHN